MITARMHRSTKVLPQPWRRHHRDLDKQQCPPVTMKNTTSPPSVFTPPTSTNKTTCTTPFTKTPPAQPSLHTSPQHGVCPCSAPPKNTKAQSVCSRSTHSTKQTVSAQSPRAPPPPASSSNATCNSHYEQHGANLERESGKVIPNVSHFSRSLMSSSALTP